MRLARDERRDMVQLLAAEGMSTRAIAPIVGVSNKTVHQDLASEVLPKVTPAPVAGLDGKTYQRKASAPSPDEHVEFPVINAQPYQHIEKTGHRADPLPTGALSGGVRSSDTPWLVSRRLSARSCCLSQAHRIKTLLEPYGATRRINRLTSQKPQQSPTTHPQSDQPNNPNQTANHLLKIV